MRRACKLSLKFATAKKRSAVADLLQAYRAAVNFYIRSLWKTPGKLDKETLARLPSERTRLSERYKSQALKQAIETVVATKLAAKAIKKWVSCPVFKGSATLDAKFVSVEPGEKSFDFVIRLSGLKKGHKIVIPTKRTAVLNKWASQPLARIIQGCSLSERGLVVWVELPDLAPKQEGVDVGIDQGMVNAIATSEGKLLGDDFTEIRNKVKRKKPGSKAKQRALRERDSYLREQVNKLPWQSMRMIAFEDLKGLKRGKSKSRGKSFRKAAAPWTYCRVIEAVTQKAQEHRVRPVAVPPAYTSQECPGCGTVHKLNRKAQEFHCISCGYQSHADVVGAVNVLNKALQLVGNLESPMLKKRVRQTGRKT